MRQLEKHFPIDRQKVRQSFSLASQTYDAAAQLQRTVGDRLINSLDTSNPTPGYVLDLGCGTGYLANQLKSKLAFNHLIALDIAFPMLVSCRKNCLQFNNFSAVCADAANLPFHSQSIDLITANLALQWLSDLHAGLAEIKRLLKPSGQLLFSTFGPHTLQELKSAWAKVDHFSHVNDFLTLEEIRAFLLNCGFKNIALSAQNHVIQYDSVLALMRELKDLGAHNVTQGRNKQITSRAKLNAMIKAYEFDNRGPAGIIATYEVILVSAQS